MVLADRSPHKVIVKSQIFKERGNKLTPNIHNCTYLDSNVNNCAYFLFSMHKKATVLVASWLVALFLLNAAINGHCDPPTVHNRAVIDVIFVVLGTMRGNLA